MYGVCASNELVFIRNLLTKTFDFGLRSAKTYQKLENQKAHPEAAFNKKFTYLQTISTTEV